LKIQFKIEEGATVDVAALSRGLWFQAIGMATLAVSIMVSAALGLWPLAQAVVGPDADVSSLSYWAGLASIMIWLTALRAYWHYRPITPSILGLLRVYNQR
jgi:hypothetical protein